MNIKISKVLFLKLGMVFILFASILVGVATSNINTINTDQEIYGLGDAATLNCNQLDSLNKIFGNEAKTDDCEDSPDEISRAANYSKLPFYQNLRFLGFILAGVGITLLFVYGFFEKFIANLVNNRKSKMKKSNQRKSSLQKRITDLKEMHQNGLISDAEYDEKRKSLLDEI